MNDQKKIIIFFTALFLVSAFYLSWTETRQTEPNLGKDWWAVYFLKPKWNDDLSFTIENHSERENFNWQILEGREIINEGSALVSKGDQNDITIAPKYFSDKTITILVSDGKYKREIYKNF
jgi:hypothetical protein